MSRPRSWWLEVFAVASQPARSTRPFQQSYYKPTGPLPPRMKVHNLQNYLAFIIISDLVEWYTHTQPIQQ